jgi:hypothetical protein
MNYTMTKPCPECPFRRGDRKPGGPVRLMSGRVDDIAGNMLGGRGDFPCHKTTVPTDDDDFEDGDGCGGRKATKDSVHCAGALIFAEKNNTDTQMMRVAGRLGMYDPRKLDQASFTEVFDTIEEMRATALDVARPRRRKGAK